VSFTITERFFTFVSGVNSIHPILFSQIFISIGFGSIQIPVSQAGFLIHILVSHNFLGV
jgi:hypothetical protein